MPDHSNEPGEASSLSIPSMNKKRKRRVRTTCLILSLLLLLMMIAGSILAFAYVKATLLTPVTKIIRPVSRGKDEPVPNGDTSSITGRTWNILLLGSDNDGKFNFPALLTQVMMIVHIDPAHHSVSLVFIPRDSWVYVPDVGGMHKIDQAFFLGATQHNNFDDGVRLARLTVEKDYGITIDRYAWVGLSGFASVINTLGGVDIDVSHPIVDDTYPDDSVKSNDPYAYQRLYLVPGPQHLDGQEALEYVRSRHADLIGDIGRTERQQQVLSALKKKLTLVNVATHLTQLIADLQGKVYSDLSEQEMLAFASFGRDLPDSAVKHLTLGPGQGNQDYGDYASVYDPSAGANQDVLIPNCSNIQPALNRIFNLGKVQSCGVSGS
jgi:polyisoprenyl-teichoic acid--peptidoglycan teichoic acid transferase